jgi:hypothetical protein
MHLHSTLTMYRALDPTGTDSIAANKAKIWRILQLLNTEQMRKSFWAIHFSMSSTRSVGLSKLFVPVGVKTTKSRHNSANLMAPSQRRTWSRWHNPISHLLNTRQSWTATKLRTNWWHIIRTAGFAKGTIPLWAWQYVQYMAQSFVCQIEW